MSLTINRCFMGLIALLLVIDIVLRLRPINANADNEDSWYSYYRNGFAFNRTEIGLEAKANQTTVEVDVLSHLHHNDNGKNSLSAPVSASIQLSNLKSSILENKGSKADLSENLPLRNKEKQITIDNASNLNKTSTQYSNQTIQTMSTSTINGENTSNRSTHLYSDLKVVASVSSRPATSYINKAWLKGVDFTPAVFDLEAVKSLHAQKGYLSKQMAQDMEDVWLYENLVYGMVNGTILESGAFDGLTYSTSWMFEKALGYNPIHIEADPETYGYLVEHRPNATNLHLAICNENRTLHYSDVSLDPCRGFIEFMNPDFFVQWHSSLFRRDVGSDVIRNIKWSDYKNPFTDLLFLDTYIDMDKYSKLRQVNCVPMRSVLEELRVKHVDVWVLDTEGSEESILHSTDFDAVRFNVIAMECENTPAAAPTNKRKIDFLATKNFTCMTVQRNCMCKHNSFVKHEISNRVEDRTTLMMDHKRRNPTYVIPATDILK